MRLQCDYCGAKSRAVENPTAMSPLERDAVAAFVAEHEATCAAGATSRERPIPQCGPFGSPKAPPVAVLKPHGHFEYTGPYGETQVGNTLSCCHCRAHWEVRVGSGKRRGFCARCAQVTCGRSECDPCVPFEARLENVEHRRPELTPLNPFAFVETPLYAPLYIPPTIGDDHAGSEAAEQGSAVETAG